MLKNITKIIVTLLTVSVLSIPLTGCNADKNKPVPGEGSGDQNQVKSQEQNQAQDQKTNFLVATDGQSRIILPPGWEKASDLHEEAELQASYVRREMYFIVLTENKQAFSKTMDLKTYLGLVKKNYEQTVKNADIGEDKEVTIDGHTARQFVVRGEVESLKVAYLVTVVDARQNYYQLVTWTLDYMFNDNRNELEQIMSSFEELKAKAENGETLKKTE